MTSFARSRCAHCHVVYHFQASGGGADKYNNGKYCPTCFKAIQDALGAIPKKERFAYRAVRDKTVEEVVEVERLREEEAQRNRKPNAIYARRVRSPMFDMSDLSNKYHSGEAKIDGITYNYSYWDRQGMEKGVVTLNVAVDIATGEIRGPWNLDEYWKTQPQFYVPEPEPPSEKPPIKFEPLPRLSERFLTTLFECDQSLERALGMAEKDKTLFEKKYTPVGRKTFSLEPLPEGALPIYDTDPDATAFVTGEEDESK